MWSLGILIGVPIVGLILLVCLAAIILGVFTRDDGGIGIALGAIGVVIVVLGVCAWAYYPWHKQYHYWSTTEGTISAKSSRFLPSGDHGVTQRFVVRFTDGRERSCDDTRCSLLKPGDHLTLSCKRQWQYAGQDGWNCNYVDSRRD